MRVTSSHSEFCYFPDPIEGFACEVVIKSGCGSSCSGFGHRSNILKVGSQSEGAISKHEPFNLQTATETNEPTRFVRALSDGFALVCQPGLGNTRGHERPGPISSDNMR